VRFAYSCRCCYIEEKQSGRDCFVGASNLNVSLVVALWIRLPPDHEIHQHQITQPAPIYRITALTTLPKIDMIFQTLFRSMRPSVTGALSGMMRSQAAQEQVRGMKVRASVKKLCEGCKVCIPRYVVWSRVDGG
jgi:large subunit ribosomal protein L36